jgi:hypothetical protein
MFPFFHFAVETPGSPARWPPRRRGDTMKFAAASSRWSIHEQCG